MKAIDRLIYDLYALTEREAIEMAVKIKEFIINRLPICKEND